MVMLLPAGAGPGQVVEQLDVVDGQQHHRLAGQVRGSFVYRARIFCGWVADEIVSVTVSNPLKSALLEAVMMNAAWLSFMLLPMVNPCWLEVVEPPESGMSGTWKVKLATFCGTVTGIGGAPGNRLAERLGQHQRRLLHLSVDELARRSRRRERPPRPTVVLQSVGFIAIAPRRGRGRRRR